MTGSIKNEWVMTMPTSRSEAFAKALREEARLSDIDGFDEATSAAAAEFIRTAGCQRARGEFVVLVDESNDAKVRLVVGSEQMPFLVNSVVATLDAHDLTLSVLLHPVLPDDESTGLTVGEMGAECYIYLEVEPGDLATLHTACDDLRQVLTHVRAAVHDHSLLRAALEEGAARTIDGEHAQLLRWFLKDNLVLLGHRRVDAQDDVETESGIARVDGASFMSDQARSAAFAWFAAGNDQPLYVKSDRIALVHRRVPLDLIVLPRRDESGFLGIDIHAGLWTSSALAASPTKIPVLRRNLSQVERTLGRSRSDHVGMALQSICRALPSDILTSLPEAQLRQLLVTAASVADRPRAKLVVLREALGWHLFAFAWLRRDDLTVGRREAIGRMIAEAAGGPVIGWTVDLDDSGHALLRFVISAPEGRGDLAEINSQALDLRLSHMVLGWRQAVEAALTKHVEPRRAGRLAKTWADALPQDYRDREKADAAAKDIIRLSRLTDGNPRVARLYVRGDAGDDLLRLKLYHSGEPPLLSAVIPVLENFGFVVHDQLRTSLAGGLGSISEFALRESATGVADPLSRADEIETAIASVLNGGSENDAFNALVVRAGLEPREVVLLRAWFRFLRQAGLAYDVVTIANALARTPHVTRACLALFEARHHPRLANEEDADAARNAVNEGLLSVLSIVDDRILRRLSGVVEAILRTNAFAEDGREALAFKIDSTAVPDMPLPAPWREIWVYSPRVEGVHLRGGIIARGGIRWSDRPEDFRTEILGLLKAQIVKNAVIVPSGAKGGFFPKRLPPAGDRAAWLAEGRECYRIFVRALLSVTDNIVDGTVEGPKNVRSRDGDDPYLVVAADKGTATFSDTANVIAGERQFWMGDAFASGGSHGYDHKAMGITARGAWVSATQHFAEMGVDLQADTVDVVGVGDMSGDVFGNGMLLSRSLRLVAAFDHRHIFLDPTPDPIPSWEERQRLFDLPSSSWDDYDRTIISKGGGVFDRSQKSIRLSSEARSALGLKAETMAPSELLVAILTAPVDLIWFGGIGTYVKGSHQSVSDVGDPTNDPHRVNGCDLRARVVVEGANLSLTQAGRVEFARSGGRINTDFIDNSAGVDCSDHEVNIKIALNAEVVAGRLSLVDRNTTLASMTDEVAGLVLENNRLQVLALSIAARGGPWHTQSFLRVMEKLNSGGKFNREIEGLASDEDYIRRAQDGAGLKRPEISVLLSHAKLTIQASIEASSLPDDPSLFPLLRASFPETMQTRFVTAIDAHSLRRSILATRIANEVVNRLGPAAAFELSEEEGVTLAQVAAAYLTCASIFGLRDLFSSIEHGDAGHEDLIERLETAGGVVRKRIADIIRIAPSGLLPNDISSSIREFAGGGKMSARSAADLDGATDSPAVRLQKLSEFDGFIGIAALVTSQGWELASTLEARRRLDHALNLDWLETAIGDVTPSSDWDRLLITGLMRDLEALKISFLILAGDTDPGGFVNDWLTHNSDRVERFGLLAQRARTSPSVSLAMLAQISGQLRTLLER